MFKVVHMLSHIYTFVHVFTCMYMYVHICTLTHECIHVHTHLYCIVYDHVSIFKILMSVQRIHITVRGMLSVLTLKVDIIALVNQALLILMEMVQIVLVCI